MLDGRLRGPPAGHRPWTCRWRGQPRSTPRRCLPPPLRWHLLPLSVLRTPPLKTTGGRAPVVWARALGAAAGSSGAGVRRCVVPATAAGEGRPPSRAPATAAGAPSFRPQPPAVAPSPVAAARFPPQSGGVARGSCGGATGGWLPTPRQQHAAASALPAHAPTLCFRCPDGYGRRAGCRRRRRPPLATSAPAAAVAPPLVSPSTAARAAATGAEAAMRGPAGGGRFCVMCPRRCECCTAGLYYERNVHVYPSLSQRACVPLSLLT